ncbi:MAG: S1 RNA-binding domain-containing protein, partial [Ginsengibacter sp.]
HKQIEEDPWNSLEETFPVGSIHEGTVTRRDDKGATVQLPYGLEGFAPARHLRREDDKLIGLDEIASFMVIEFDRNDKKIILSHSRIWEKEKADEKNAQLNEKRADAETTKKAVKNIQSKVEKTTLGDLGVLADLKKKMDDETNQETTEVIAKTEEPEAKEVVAKKAPAKKKKAEVPDAEKKAEETLSQTPPPPADEPKQIVAEADAASEEAKPEEPEADEIKSEDNE